MEAIVALGQRTGVALAAHGLGKRFGERVAFDDVSFEIGYGEVFGFLGPNGAGKTTTVRTLSALISPTSGTATVAGLQLTEDNRARIRQRIAVMPEAPGLYPRLTIAENLECFAGLYALADPAERVRRVLAAAPSSRTKKTRSPPPSVWPTGRTMPAAASPRVCARR